MFRTAGHRGGDRPDPERTTTRQPLQGAERASPARSASRWHPLSVASARSPALAYSLDHNTASDGRRDRAAMAAHAVSGALVYAKEPGSAGPGVTRSTVAQNTPATGAPSASGTPQVGQVLTADTSGIADADGLTNASYGYQWLRVNGSPRPQFQTQRRAATPGGCRCGQLHQDSGVLHDDIGSEEVLVSNATEEVTTAPIPVIWEGRVTVGEGTQGDKVWLGFTLFGGSLGSISLPRSVRVAESTYSVQLILHTAADIYLGMSSKLPENFVLQIDDAEFNSADASGNKQMRHTFTVAEHRTELVEGDEVVVSLRSSAMASALSADARTVGTLATSGVAQRTLPPAPTAPSARPNSPATGAPTTTGTAESAKF